MTKSLTFKEAILLARDVGIVHVRRDWTNEEIVLDLADGSELHFKSNYDGPYSDVTPGNGIEPPSVYLVKK